MERLSVPMHRMWDRARPGAASGFRAIAAGPVGRNQPPHAPGPFRRAPHGPMGSREGRCGQLWRCRDRIGTDGRGDHSLVGGTGRACRTCRTSSPAPALRGADAAGPAPNPWIPAGNASHPVPSQATGHEDYRGPVGRSPLRAATKSRRDHPGSRGRSCDDIASELVAWPATGLDLLHLWQRGDPRMASGWRRGPTPQAETPKCSEWHWEGYQSRWQSLCWQRAE